MKDMHLVAKSKLLKQAESQLRVVLSGNKSNSLPVNSSESGLSTDCESFTLLLLSCLTPWPTAEGRGMGFCHLSSVTEGSF